MVKLIENYQMLRKNAIYRVLHEGHDYVTVSRKGRAIHVPKQFVENV